MHTLAQRSSSCRVVQWATGNIGLCSLRAVIEHPALDLVGVYVYSEAKEGRDAGDLCGSAPTGVFATREIEDILALRPDCVLYMADRANIDDLCRLLEAGINVVTTRSEFHRPQIMKPDVRERIEAACRRGGASLHSTGSSPGFITEAMPLVLTSIARRLDRLEADVIDAAYRGWLAEGLSPDGIVARELERRTGDPDRLRSQYRPALPDAARSGAPRGGDRGRKDRGRHHRRPADAGHGDAPGAAAPAIQRQLVPHL